MPAPEQTLYEGKPSGRVVLVWLFKHIFVYIIIAAFLAFSFARIIANENTGVRTGVIDVILLIVLCVLFLVLIYDIFLYRTYKYIITDKGVYFKGGIFIKRQKLVPFFKITNVEVSQNLIEQIFCVSKIGFQTAGTGGRPMPEITFEGLRDAEQPKQIVYQQIEKTRKAGKTDE